ncbi:DUF2568 domain-containing protein [Specibacter sp. AOP5-B1-6]|uniref:DUF2568 domain-containing protein n=1 Tax=Specibacter sp. AOP5-B1-6 TaxID=3457653 RepID=UPI00402B1F6C
MGRRRVADAKAARIDLATLTPVVDVASKFLGFALEVAMVAAFLFWGFKQDSPWNLILGLGIPGVVVVFWGVFLAPRSERRLNGQLVSLLSLVLFLAAAAALLSVGSTGLGIAMAVLAVAQFGATRFLERPNRRS